MNRVITLALFLVQALNTQAQTAISLSGSNVVVTFPTTSNRLYVVQSADFLSPAGWSTMASNIVGTGAVLTNLDTGAAGLAARFYRVGSSNPSTNGGTVVAQVQFAGGAPVANALVVITYPVDLGQDGYTDGNGSIVFANVPVGGYTVNAYSPDNGTDVQATGTVATVGALAVTTLLMPGSGSVQVWVDYDSDEPATSAPVYVISGTITNGPGYTDSSGEDAFQGIFIEIFQRRNDRKASDKLRDQAEFQEIFRLDPAQNFAGAAFVRRAHGCSESDRRRFSARRNDLFEAGKGATADEQDVGRIDLKEFLLWMLAAALRRHRGHGSFHDLEQSLLDTFSRHVARDRRIVGLARNLVDFVDIDDAALSPFDIIVRRL